MENGHKFKSKVAGQSREVRIDRRLAKRNKKMRTNIRDREGERPHLSSGQFLEGTSYEDTRKCVHCSRVRPIKYFINMAIDAEARGLNGLNIHCRSCQTVSYVKGYKKGEFITSSGESDNSSDEEEVPVKRRREESGSEEEEEEEEVPVKRRREESGSEHEESEESGSEEIGSEDEESEESGYEEEEEESGSEDEESGYESEDIFIVKKIHDEDKGKVLIEWKNYPKRKDWTWEPKENLLGSHFR
jgi:hypothetical protein